MSTTTTSSKNPNNSPNNKNKKSKSPPSSESNRTITQITTTTTDQQQSHQSTEELLVSQLKSCQRLALKRPLEPTYDHLLLNNNHHHHHHRQNNRHHYNNSGHNGFKAPKIIRDSLYRKFGAGLRTTVESYMGTYGAESVSGPEQGGSRGVGRYRKGLDDDAMRAAFTLREGGKMTHEQRGLIRAVLAAGNRRKLGVGGGLGQMGMMEEGVRQKKMEAMALGLQESCKEKDRKVLNKARQKIEKAILGREKAKTTSNSGNSGGGDHRSNKVIISMNEKLRNTEKDHQTASEREVEDRERMVSIERGREKARRLTEQKERDKAIKEKEEAIRKARMMETSEEALHRLYEPIFRQLWDMEFANLHNTNPFRIVIDASNCAAMGCPDYADIIEIPMNLTYIQEKVSGKKYETLQEFFEDVKLLISNALLYNSDPNNEYHKAANFLKKKFQKMGEKVMNEVQQQL